MKLFRIISGAQAGHIFIYMGDAFGISDEMAAQAVRYFLPPMRKAIERRAETMGGLIEVLEFLGSRRCDRAMADPRIFGHERVAEEGRSILGFLFGNSAYMKRLIDNRAGALQIDREILETMLPYIAVLAIGAVEERTRRPLGVVLHRMAKGSLEPRALLNPYASLATQLKRRHSREQRPGGLFSGLFARGARPETERRAQAV